MGSRLRNPVRVMDEKTHPLRRFFGLRSALFENNASRANAVCIDKKGKAVKMNIKTRLRREPLPQQQGYDKTGRLQRRTRRLTWWDEIERQEPLPQQQGYDKTDRPQRQINQAGQQPPYDQAVAYPRPATRAGHEKREASCYSPEAARWVGVLDCTHTQNRICVLERERKQKTRTHKTRREQGRI